MNPHESPDTNSEQMNLTEKKLSSDKSQTASQKYFNNKKYDHVIFLHTHNGCRLQGLFLREEIIAMDKALVLFDFHGSGLSTGSYVSFGWYETFDIDAVSPKSIFSELDSSRWSDS